MVQKADTVRSLLHLPILSTPELVITKLSFWQHLGFVGVIRCVTSHSHFEALFKINALINKKIWSTIPVKHCTNFLLFTLLVITSFSLHFQKQFWMLTNFKLIHQKIGRSYTDFFGFIKILQRISIQWIIFQMGVMWSWYRLVRYPEEFIKRTFNDIKIHSCNILPK